LAEKLHALQNCVSYWTRITLRFISEYGVAGMWRGLFLKMQDRFAEQKISTLTISPNLRDSEAPFPFDSPSRVPGAGRGVTAIFSAGGRRSLG